jgi:hypothetical protein
MSTQPNPKTGYDIYSVSSHNEPIFPEWGVQIGEIAHNLRSALDGLVYQLAYLRTTPKAPERTQFPIFRSRHDRKTVKGRQINGFHPGSDRHIRLLAPIHQTRLERLQPYRRGRGGGKNPLWLLNELSNSDKHRLIEVAGTKWGGGPITALWSAGPNNKFESKYADNPLIIKKRVLLKYGAKLVEAPRGMDVAPSIFPTICFWEGCRIVKWLPVRHTLDRIAEHVSEIVESFAPEFT